MKCESNPIEFYGRQQVESPQTKNEILDTFSSIKSEDSPVNCHPAYATLGSCSWPLVNIKAPVAYDMC